MPITDEDMWPVADRLAATEQKPALRAIRAHRLIGDLNREVAWNNDGDVALVRVPGDGPGVNAAARAR